LVDARNDKHVWAQSYDEDIRDALVLQSRITRATAEQIRANLNTQELATLDKSKTVNPEAYEAYLKGRYFWNKRTADGLSTAIEYFSRAIKIDPNSAEAYSGLADSTQYRAIGSTARFLHMMLSPKPRQPQLRHWHWTIPSVKPTPPWLSPWTFMAGIGMLPKENIQRQSNSTLAMRQPINGISGISSWSAEMTMLCSN
jgi:hypothetical protein